MSQQDVESTALDHSRQPSGLLANVRVVSLLTMASRVLGLLRDIGMAILFGNGVILDSFSVAFRIPNLARGILGEGALSTAFLPAFLNEEQTNGTDSAYRLASTVLSILMMGLAVLVCLIFVILIVAIYFIPMDSDLRLLLGLMAVIFPYLFFICSAAQVNALLHARNHFFWPAFTPILLNCVWLGAIIVSATFIKSQLSRVYFISGSLLFGGMLQLLVPIPTAKKFGLHFSGIDRDSLSTVRSMFWGMLPIVLGLSISQLNALCDSFIAWGFAHFEIVLPTWDEPPVTSGTASALYFGQRMYQFPLGVFGVALGTVLYPRLTRHAQSKQFEQMREDVSYGLRLIAVIGIPASVGLLMLAEPLTEALFRHGAFNSDDSLQTSQMIAAYGIAVWAFIALLVIHRGFYALDDRMTPVRIGLIAVGTNFVLNFVLMFFFGAVGLAYATSIASIIQVIAVFIMFEKKIGSINKMQLWSTILKAIIASAVMFAVGSLIITGIVWSDTLSSRFGRLVFGFLAAGATYLAMAKLLGMRDLFSLINRKRSEVKLR